LYFKKIAMKSPSFAQQAPTAPVDIFIEGWGRMGMNWGVGKVMGEIQALLFLDSRPLSLEDMSERLKTSRSNISLNVRALQDLGVVKKVVRPGDRKDYYTAEENIGLVARRMAAQKKKRELDPALEIVRRALRAAESTESSNGIDIDRLRDLKRLIEVIGGVFDAFIDEARTGAVPGEATSRTNS
jgi:DNA-binding transcriptional regulator GbsR (MarR family)